MTLSFIADSHKYESDGNIKWTSVTTLLSAYKEPFDAKKVAEKSSRNKKSKWYGISPEEIQAIWKSEADRSTTLGSWYHDQREQDLVSCNVIERYGKQLPIIKPIEENGIKYAPSQKLIDGLYPELMVYLQSASVCGQADLVEVVEGVVNVHDYKTSKKIDRTSYVNWEGIPKKMLKPLNHLQDCHINHYGLQLSLYMYIILKHNPSLKPGKLIIHHVKFEEAEEKDQYGFPIILLENGTPMVKDIEYIEVPYMKREVELILKGIK
ncbi:MAG: hypothetical protein EOL97_13740 [Spirochaetia bacterium]|nr:hypothetical protein [Spirochaetia bacterium]